MPPKKKDKKKKEDIIIDGVKTSDFTREQLEGFALHLKEVLDREREERNQFQVERDKIRTYWEITQEQLDDARAELRIKDREMEDAREKNDDEITFFKQKVKHLLYEQQNTISELKAESMVQLKDANDDFTARGNELLKDKTDLKEKLRDQQIAAENEIKALKLAHSQDINNKRLEFEQRLKEMEEKFEKKIATMRNDLAIKHAMEMSENEERKNQHITELIKNHENAFTEIKNYYNDITLNNLALINSLKEEIDSLMKQCERLNKQIREVTAENKKLVEPLKKVQLENKEMKRQMSNYEKDKVALQNTMLLYNDTKKQLDALKWENETLELRFVGVNKERLELKAKFIDAVLEVQYKTGLKNVLLEKHIKNMNSQAEYRNSMLLQMGMVAGLSPDAINQRFDQLIKEKDTMIQDLQYELARVIKSHDDLLQTYEAIMQKYEVPQTELGFIPLRLKQESAGKIGRSPAGLVTKNI